MTKETIFEQLQLISERIKEKYNADKVILYGSYATNTATEDSDIDLLIIAPTTERFYERMANVRGLIRDLRYGLPVSPIVLTPNESKEQKEKGNHFIQEILENGIEL